MYNFEYHCLKGDLPDKLYNKELDEPTQLGWFLINTDHLINVFKRVLHKGESDD